MKSFDLNYACDDSIVYNFPSFVWACCSMVLAIDGSSIGTH